MKNNNKITTQYSNNQMFILEIKHLISVARQASVRTFDLQTDIGKRIFCDMLIING
jgi:hypothetical protein